MPAKADEEPYKIYKPERYFYTSEQVSYGLVGAQLLKAHEPVTMKPDKWLPFSSHGSKLCFFIGFLSLKDDMAKAIGEVLENTFGKEEYDNVFMFSPPFLTGTVRDSENNSYALTGERNLRSGSADMYSDRQVISVCSAVEGEPKDIVEITFTPLQTFQAQSIYWSDQIRNYDPKPPGFE